MGRVSSLSVPEIEAISASEGRGDTWLGAWLGALGALGDGDCGAGVCDGVGREGWRISAAVPGASDCGFAGTGEVVPRENLSRVPISDPSPSLLEPSGREIALFG